MLAVLSLTDFHTMSQTANIRSKLAKTVRQKSKRTGVDKSASSSEKSVDNVDKLLRNNQTTNDVDNVFRDNKTRSHTKRRLGVNRRARRSVSRESFVETLVVVDKEMIDYHGKGFIEPYVLTIMNIVSMDFGRVLIIFTVSWMIVSRTLAWFSRSGNNVRYYMMRVRSHDHRMKSDCEWIEFNYNDFVAYLWYMGGVSYLLLPACRSIPSGFAHLKANLALDFRVRTFDDLWNRHVPYFVKSRIFWELTKFLNWRAKLLCWQKIASLAYFANG